MSFDPWTATYDEAAIFSESLCAQDDDNGRLLGPTDPLCQFEAAQLVNAKREAIESGNGLAVMDCMNTLVTHGLVAPVWLAEAFKIRYDAVQNLQAKSWDDSAAFGRPYPKGMNFNAKKKAMRGRFLVWVEIYKRLEANPKLAIDKNLFDEVGRALHYGATLTEEYYREAIELLGKPIVLLDRKRRARKSR